ncbi:hypothetical protein IJV57_01445 [Candidatus Saccharibacteria bacterium]|nr:hypothetical protein [Candidatus Saccharibacteria bacterium]
MEQGNTATPDELQQAINSITNGGAQNDATNAVAQVENSILGAAPAPAPAPAPEAAPAPMEIVSAKAQYGDPDLDKVKSMALSDLRPILEKVDIAPEKKFMIYKDIIDLTEDKACIEPAYNSARLIADEKAKGEALVFIVECIDKLGIQMTIGGESDAA